MNAEDTIALLNRLIEVSRDGEYGFRTSAEHLRDPDLRRLYQRCADDCRAGVAELQGLVVALGGRAETAGSATGALHRGWVAVRSALSGYGDLRILEETARGEQAALQAYARALQGDLPPSVRSVLEGQYEGVQRNHAEVRALADRVRPLSA